MRKFFCGLLTGFMALSVVSFSFADNSGYYVGVKTGLSIQDYYDVKFVNPRITGTSKDNDSENTRILSFQIGKTLSTLPFRLEVEYASTGEVEFRRFHTPFTTVYQDISVESTRVMFNAYYDHELGFASMYVGAGVGLAFNKTDAIQGTATVGHFADETSTDVAWNLGTGVSKDISTRSFGNYTADLGYRYVNLGEADTGQSQFNLRDERFEGKLDAHEITFGLRYNF